MAKRELVMSGGAAYGAFSDGVLTVLADNKKDYDFVSGVSVGAISLGMISQFPKGEIEQAVERLDHIWLNELSGDKNIYKSWYYGILGPLPALNHEALYNSHPLWKLILKNMDDDLVRKAGRELRVGCCALGSGEYFEAAEDELHLSDWVIASSGMLPYLLPIRLDEGEENEDVWCDGGYRHVIPFTSAIEAGCDEIDVVITGPDKTKSISTKNNWCGTKFNTLKTGMRVVGIMSDQIFKADVKRVLQVDHYNQLIDALGDNHELTRGKKKIKLRVFMPENFLPGSSLSFDPELTKKRRQIGIETAEKVLCDQP